MADALDQLERRIKPPNRRVRVKKYRIERLKCQPHVKLSSAIGKLWQNLQQRCVHPRVVAIRRGAADHHERRAAGDVRGDAFHRSLEVPYPHPGVERCGSETIRIHSVDRRLDR